MTQLPPEQPDTELGYVGQKLLQAPQLFGSFEVLTQVVPHSVWPGGHTATHSPPWQA
jgi:hypothetical protein